MKAIVCTKYGPLEVLALKEVEKPIPRDNEVLIKVHAASLNAYDWRIESIGRNVTQFKPGEDVFGDLAGYGQGAFAEYVCAPENALALKPTRITFEEAAAVPMAAVTALQGLRDIGQIREGQEVLINGASGGVGTFAVQIAKFFGAEVTAVCSTGKVDLIRSIGADHVIDYTREDFTKSEDRYDLIFAVNGYHLISDYKRALKPEGIYVMAGGSMSQIFQALLIGPLISMVGNKKMRAVSVKPNQKDLVFIKELIEAGKVKPVIDRYYQLHEVPEALQYLWEGHARGKVVVTVAHDIKGQAENRA